MTGVGAGDELLADVCRTLEHAGFDFALSDTDEDGLRVRREADAVVVTWEPVPGVGSSAPCDGS
ncbi:hypothetical protein [Streptomyces echinatus]|uniref:hypothetical protein n=1 Tax=Streptomyces echinatus TaxID=67293 RepID=UPI0037901271